MIDDLGSSVLDPNRVQVSIALIVGASGGLVAFHGGAEPWVILAATIVGLLLGVALTAYLSWIAPDTGDPRRRDRP